MQASYIHNWQTEREASLKISSGVTHTSLQTRSEHLQEAVQICTIDLQDPYTEVMVASAQGGVTRLETVRNLAEEQMNQGHRVVAAMNGDFFTSLGIPSGLQIVAGEIICSPRTNKVAMVIMEDRSVRLLRHIQMEAKVAAGLQDLAIDAINRTRSLAKDNHLYLYTARFGGSTNTPFGGVEAVIELEDAKACLKPGQKLRGLVQKIEERGNTVISAGSVVLSASGEKARWLLTHLKMGVILELQVSYDQGVDGARQVLSGNSNLAFPLLIDGQLASEITDAQNPFYSDRHPRTMLATKGDKLHIVVIDGRQPGYSDGVTFAEGAYLLQSLGMEQAINVDGGGSTTFLVRSPGYTNLEVMNRPSDGFERPVGNGLVVTNTAPSSELRELIIEPSGQVLVLQGSAILFNVKGVDRFLNPVPVKHEDVNWELQGQIGIISKIGELRVENAEGSGTLKVGIGQVETSIELQCINTIAKLVLETESTILEPGSIVTLRPRAFSHEGQEIHLSADALQWSIEGEIGEINRRGELTLTSDLKNGAVAAAYGSMVARQEVQVGQEPIVLVDFESTTGLRVQSKNVVPGSVSFSQVSRPEPIRFGAFSGRLTYDFAGQIGHSSVTIGLLDANGELGREIPGKPWRFGIWVYGDGQKHWLRLVTTDASNNRRNLDFTALGGLDWVGWRYVTLDVPPNTVYPLTVLGIVLMEPNDSNKNSGVVYFDNFRAEYVNLNEDLEGPVFQDLFPLPESVVEHELSQISLRIIDEDSGVNASSIQMWINDQLVATSFDAKSGVISYLSDTPLPEGEYTVQVHATDNAGNPTLPVDWDFTRKRDRNAKKAI